MIFVDVIFGGVERQMDYETFEACSANVPSVRVGNHGYSIAVSSILYSSANNIFQFKIPFVVPWSKRLPRIVVLGVRLAA